MKLVVLARVTAAAAKDEAEEYQRFEALKIRLEAQQSRVEAAWNLLGRYDYLLMLDVPDDVEAAFAALSLIAQSGTMTTETFLAMPLDRYFRIAADIGSRAAPARRLTQRSAPALSGGRGRRVDGGVPGRRLRPSRSRDDDCS